MKLCNIIAHNDALYRQLQGIYKTKVVQFVDMNENQSAYQRVYAKDMARIYEIEQKYLFLRSATEHNKEVKIPPQIENTSVDSIFTLERDLDAII